MQDIRLNYHGDQTIPLGTERDIEQLQHIYDLLFHILAYHAHLHHIKIKKKKNYTCLPLLHTYFYLQEKEDKGKMLTISAPKNQRMKDYADSQKSTKNVRNISGYI